MNRFILVGLGIANTVVHLFIPEMHFWYIAQFFFGLSFLAKD